MVGTSRGKQSLAAIATPTSVIQYPEPPFDLTEEEAEEWRAIVRSKIPEHFSRDTHPLLSQLCRHTIAARRIAALVQQCLSKKGADWSRKEYFILLQQQSAESVSILNLSRAMRITQQSRIDKTASGKLRSVNLTKNPWDRNG